MTIINSAPHLTKITDLQPNTVYSNGSKQSEIKEDALLFAKEAITQYEGDGAVIDKYDPPTKNGKIDYAEVENKNFKNDFSEYDLDGKSGLSKEEVASYIMTLDGIEFVPDEKYFGWDFREDADITEDDLKKGQFSEDNIDGVIDENILKALDTMDAETLKETAQEIYDENFQKEPWYKKIFG